MYMHDKRQAGKKNSTKIPQEGIRPIDACHMAEIVTLIQLFMREMKTPRNI